MLRISKLLKIVYIYLQRIVTLVRTFHTEFKYVSVSVAPLVVCICRLIVYCSTMRGHIKGTDMQFYKFHIYEWLEYMCLGYPSAWYGCIIQTNRGQEAEVVKNVITPAIGSIHYHSIILSASDY